MLVSDRRETRVTAEVFQALYAQEHGTARQSVESRRARIEPFVAWMRKKGHRRLTVGEWREWLKTFGNLPA